MAQGPRLNVLWDRSYVGEEYVTVAIQMANPAGHDWQHLHRRSALISRAIPACDQRVAQQALIVTCQHVADPGLRCKQLRTGEPNAQKL